MSNKSLKRKGIPQTDTISQRWELVEGEVNEI